MNWNYFYLIIPVAFFVLMFWGMWENRRNRGR